MITEALELEVDYRNGVLLWINRHDMRIHILTWRKIV